MSDADLWLGLDVGTQSVKAIVVDDVGTLRGSGAAPLTSERVGERHEQSPEAWVDAAAAAVRGALARLSTAEKAGIRGLSVCATSGSITVVDGAGQPVMAGIMYDDARAGALADEVQAADAPLWSRLGYRIQPTWALPKIVWLTRHGLLGEGRHVAHQVDVVTGAIVGGRVATDSSHALKSGYDLVGSRWPGTALETLDVDPAKLPDVVAPGDTLGRSSTTWSDRTGLPEGVPVTAGMTDGCAAQISAGTLSPGDWHSVVGTTLVVKTVSNDLLRERDGGLYSHRSPVPGQWFPGGASSVGAGILTTLLPRIDLAAATERVASRFDGDLLAIPASYPLNGRGERFPLTRPDAVGFVDAGDGPKSMAEAAAHLDEDALFAAILLGVACVERLCVDTVARAGSPVTGRVTSSGGGARNPWWVQLRADLLGRPIDLPATSEGSLGMAVIAAWASDRTQDLATVADRLSAPVTTVEPGPDRGADEAYARFQASLERQGWLPA